MLRNEFSNIVWTHLFCFIGVIAFDAGDNKINMYCTVWGFLVPGTRYQEVKYSTSTSESYRQEYRFVPVPILKHSNEQQEV